MLRTHQRNKNTDTMNGMRVDHTATASICNLLFLGIVDGTKLDSNATKNLSISPPFSYNQEGSSSTRY